MTDESPGQVRQRDHSFADAIASGLVVASIGVGVMLMFAMVFALKAASEIHWSLGGIVMIGIFFLIGFGSVLLSPPGKD